MLADCKLSRILFVVLQPSDKWKLSSSGFQSNSSTFIKVRTVAVVVHGEFDESSSNSVTAEKSSQQAHRVMHHLKLVPIYFLASFTYLYHSVTISVSCETQKEEILSMECQTC